VKSRACGRGVAWGDKSGVDDESTRNVLRRKGMEDAFTPAGMLRHKPASAAAVSFHGTTEDPHLWARHSIRPVTLSLKVIALEDPAKRPSSYMRNKSAFSALPYLSSTPVYSSRKCMNLRGEQLIDNFCHPAHNRACSSFSH